MDREFRHHTGSCLAHANTARPRANSPAPPSVKAGTKKRLKPSDPLSPFGAPPSSRLSANDPIPNNSCTAPKDKSAPQRLVVLSLQILVQQHTPCDLRPFSSRRRSSATRQSRPWLHPLPRSSQHTSPYRTKSATSHHTRNCGSVKAAAEVAAVVAEAVREAARHPAVQGLPAVQGHPAAHREARVAHRAVHRAVRQAHRDRKCHFYVSVHCHDGPAPIFGMFLGLGNGK